MVFHDTGSMWCRPSMVSHMVWPYSSEFVRQYQFCAKAKRRAHCFCISNIETTVSLGRAISLRQLPFAVLSDNVFWNRCICREEMTQWREDMNLFLSNKIIFCKRAQRMSKLLFLARENRNNFFKPLCNVVLLYRDEYHRWSHLWDYGKNKRNIRIPDVVFKNFTSGMFSCKTLVSLS